MAEDDAAAALELLATPPGAPIPQAANPEEVQAIEKSQSWMFGPGVVGWGAAEKIVRGDSTGEAALKLYVVRKIAKDYMIADHRIPEFVEIPGHGTVAVDVEAIGRQDPETFIGPKRPCPPGYSIGLLGGESGTFSCVVKNKPGSEFILSNSHVIANYGMAAPGMAIVQPGPGDGGTANDEIATYEASVPFNFSPGFNNQCDAAIALITDAGAVDASIPKIGIPTSRPGAMTIGQAVQKSGRTTEYTTGVVKDLNYRTLMSYPKPGGGSGTVGFRDQVLCTKYSASGDSGALVCAMDGAGVGLHWAGSSATSVFSPIDTVLALLDVSFL